MSDHPRLTRVLADWCRRHNESLGYADDPEMEAYVASLIATDEEGIADRLEDALDCCRFVFPNGTPCAARERESVHGAREDDWEHAYDPLVAP